MVEGLLQLAGLIGGFRGARGKGAPCAWMTLNCSAKPCPEMTKLVTVSI